MSLRLFRGPATGDYFLLFLLTAGSALGRRICCWSTAITNQDSSPCPWKMLFILAITLMHPCEIVRS